MEAKQINPEAVFEAYCVFAEISGAERGACAAVAKELGTPRSTITRMAKRYRFSARYNREVQPIVRSKTNESVATTAAAWREKSAKAGSELVDRAMEALQTMPIESVRDGIAAIKQGAAMVDKATEPSQKRVSVDVDVVLKERFERFVTEPAQTPKLTVDFGDLDDE